MLARAHRLRKSGEFRDAMSGGRRVRGRYIIAFVSPTEHQTRIGFVVSRTIGGNSVGRHRMMRQLRHAVAPLLPALSPHAAIVIKALPAARAACFADLQADLEATLHRAAR